MKKTLLFTLLMMSLSVSSQIPSYYNNVDLNLTGTSLKNELAVKVSSTHHTNLSYTPGVWNALKQTDLDPNNPNKVVLIYGYSDTDGNYVTDRTRSKDANGGTAGSQWNREHVYPKSLGNPNLGTSGPGADVHHLRAADISFNSQRSSKKFAAGSGNAGNVAGGWYPGDEWKGDVARMMMYMYLRYGNQCLPTNVGNGSTISSDANMLNLFIQWNVEDPVSDFEKQRNPIIEGLQGNRNPFIDNPAFATQIWGGPQAEDLFGNGSGGTDTQSPTTPTNLSSSNITQNTVNLSWTASTDNVSVSGYRVYRNGSLVASTANTSFGVTGLSSGMTYTFTVSAFDAAGNTSATSNSVSVTTTAAPTTGNASELFISEYVEGSSNNKAIEIANFTGTTVDLSNYSLKKATNGSGSWSSTLSLNGQLADGEVYVIVNSSATTSLKNKANLTNTTVLSFNGNDAVSLFKGTTALDIIGNPSSSAVFGQNVTLQRKSSVTSPRTSYLASEWTILNQDAYSGLGSHVMNGVSNPTTDTSAPSSPSGMSVSSITQSSAVLSWNAASDNIGVTGYDVYNGTNKVATVTSTNLVLNNLSSNTSYAYYVKAFDAAGNASLASNTTSFTTLANTVTYCSSKGSNANYEWIDYVAFGGVSKTSSNNGGYGNHTATTGNLNFGNNTIVFSAGFSSSSYTEFWKVWIDFNQNGTFESSEEVVSGSSSSSANLSATFAVPTSAKTGLTRMRVSMKWDASQTACETFAYGEVEDYTVNIGSSSRSFTNAFNELSTVLGDESRVFDALVYPNPTDSAVSIKIKDGRQTTFRLYNSNGKIVKKGRVLNALNLELLPAGLYLIEVNDGQKSFIKKLIKK